jgi:hypothetical protein
VKKLSRSNASAFKLSIKNPTDYNASETEQPRVSFDKVLCVKVGFRFSLLVGVYVSVGLSYFADGVLEIFCRSFGAESALDEGRSIEIAWIDPATDQSFCK